MSESEQPKRRRWWQVLRSVLAAGFGVQSRDEQAQDFSGGKAWMFILAGLIATAGFVIAVMLLVTWALHLAESAG